MGIGAARVFLPPSALAGAPAPALYYLAGLTCSEEHLPTKGGALALAAELGLADRIDWISTGGGASLEFVEGRELPGVAAIPEA